MCVNNFKGRRYMFLLQGTLKKTDLWESDINVTDENNFTLLMMAALHNRYITLCGFLAELWGIDCSRSIIHVPAFV